MDTSPSAYANGGTPLALFATWNDAVRAINALLWRIAAEQPGVLAIVFVVLLVSAFVVFGVPVIVVACVWKRNREKAMYTALSSTERLAVQSPEDMNVTLDDSEEELRDTATLTPAQGSFKLPRIPIPVKNALNDAAADDPDMHMTPRTRATIIRNWTPRK